MSTLLQRVPVRWAPEERAGFPEVPPAQLDGGFPWVLVFALAAVIMLIIGIIVVWLRRQRRNLRGARYGGSADWRDASWPTPIRGRLRTRSASGSMVRRDGGQALDDLIGLRPEMFRALRKDDIELAWPSQPVVDRDGGLIDCACEPIPARFLQAGAPRTLDKAIGSDMSRADRVYLLRQVARFLQELHLKGWAFGAVWWDSFLYCEDVKPRLLVRNAEFARRLGDEPAFARSVPAGLRDESPKRDFDAFPSLRTDRCRFAVLVQQLLQDTKFDKPIVPGRDTALDSLVDNHVAQLLVAGAQAGRLGPLVCEWLAAFDDPIFTIGASQR